MLLGQSLLFIIHLGIQWTMLVANAQQQPQCRLLLQKGADLDPTTNPDHGFPVNGSSSGSAMSHQPTATTASTSSASAIPALPAFNYGQDKIRAVNLGGWLVLEPWITPSVFERTGNDNVLDEFTLGQLVDRQSAEQILTEHWETWITEDDFVAINAAGLNHVRIPLGYWSVPLTADDSSYSTSPDPYIPGAWTYLLRGLTWAQKHGVHVIVDLHGAPGSQNGYDNSGQRTDSPQWALDPALIARTVDVVKYIAVNLGGMVDVLELLNEPAGFRGGDWETAVRQFWLDGYDAVRSATESGIKVMIGDAFLGVQSWTDFLVPPRGQGVLMDFHEYQIFSDDELSQSVDEHIQVACSYIPTLTSFASQNIWTVVGEWSNAITDCAKWLNGRGVGARWDNTYSDSGTYHGSCANYTGSYENFSDDYKDTLRRYFEVQVEVGEGVQGWAFWTWKAEEADEWSYQRGLEGGWIPNDPADRMYPNICS